MECRKRLKECRKGLKKCRKGLKKCRKGLKECRKRLKECRKRLKEYMKMLKECRKRLKECRKRLKECGRYRIQEDTERKKEGNVYLTTFLFTIICIKPTAKDHRGNERGNPLLPLHGLLVLINSKGSFICTIPLTGQHVTQPLQHQLWSTGWNKKYLNGYTRCHQPLILKEYCGYVKKYRRKV